MEIKKCYYCGLGADLCKCSTGYVNSVASETIISRTCNCGDKIKQLEAENKKFREVIKRLGGNKKLCKACVDIRAGKRLR